MKRKLLEEALNEISDRHIAFAYKKKRNRLPWLGAVAAVLTAAILLGIFTNAPSSVFTPASATGLVAAPTYPEMVRYGEDGWWESVHALHGQPMEYAASAKSFFRKSLEVFLTPQGGENTVCSPLNMYLALAMLTETTGAETREELLSALGCTDISEVRTMANRLWSAHYWNDGLSTSIPANSLWLDEDYAYTEETVKCLAQQYYASTYRGALGSAEMNGALQSWLNEQTGGLLKDYVNDLRMDPDTSFALASTLYYQVQWAERFQEAQNTTGIFHTPSGDTEVTFMNRTDTYGVYFWGERFGAVRLHLEDDSSMWLILPDEGVDPAEILQDEDLYEMLEQGSFYENRSSLIVNLSLPKFDISAQQDLIAGLKQMGIQKVFTAGSADFSALIPANDGGYVSNISHAARVAIDEDGVTAAAYTTIFRHGSAMPPDEEIDFVLNRPFLFLIQSSDAVPVFSGIVNAP